MSQLMMCGNPKYCECQDSTIGSKTSVNWTYNLVLMFLNYEMDDRTTKLKIKDRENVTILCGF